VPAVSSCLIDPLFAELEALLGTQPEISPTHPWGCHRRRIPHRVVFEHIVAAMVHGSGYELIASAGCSDRTIRRRLKEWAEKGIGQKLHQITLAAYDKIVGLELDDLATDGCITKALCGGDKAGPSPVDRRKGGLKRSTTTTPEACPWDWSPPARTDTTHPCWNPPSKTPDNRSGRHPRNPRCTWTPATTANQAETFLPPTSWSARSPKKESPAQSKSANDGSSNAQTHE